jgi:hypothetical protein
MGLFFIVVQLSYSNNEPLCGLKKKGEKKIWRRKQEIKAAAS